MVQIWRLSNKTITTSEWHSYYHFIFRVIMFRNRNYSTTVTQEGPTLNSSPTVSDVWSQKLIRSSVSFQERRHLLCLKPQSYYCDNNENNLPLSPYTQPFSLGRRDGGKRGVKMEGQETVEQSRTFSLTVPYLSTLVQFGHPSLLEVEEVRLWKAKHTVSLSFIRMFDRNVTNTKPERKELCSLVEPRSFILSEASPEGFYRPKKSQRKWRVTGKKKKCD